MADPTTAPSSYTRSNNDKIVFWILWALLLLPVIWLIMMVIGSGFSLMLLLLVAQIAVHGISLKWFLDPSKPMSKVSLILLGGTGLLYFLAFSGCVIMLFTA